MEVHFIEELSNQKTCFRCHYRESPNFLLNYDNYTRTDGITALELWKHFNPFFIDNFEEEYFGKVYLYDETKLFDVIPNIDKPNKDWIQLLKSPKISGKYFEDYVLVPLCNFGNDTLINCTLFEEAEISVNQKRCFTFKRKEFVSDIDMDKGLNFVVNYRMPIFRPDYQPVQLIIHEPGTYPDLLTMRSRKINILPQRHLQIGLKATSIQTTEDFDTMSLRKRNCKHEKKYSKINCVMDTIIDLAKKQCGCLPWYILNRSGSP